MTPPAPTTTETARPVIVYWRCPECGAQVGVPLPFAVYDDGAFWDENRRTTRQAEQLVEDHEARHGIGVA